MHKTLRNVTVKDAESGTISAVFSTFNVIDSDGDITLPGAIEDGMKVVISAYGHQSHYGVLPVGKGVIRTTDTEAILEGQFFMDTTHGRDTFATVKQLDDLGEWSYSLHDVTSKSGELDGQRVNYLEKIGLIKEVSPVLMGAGVNTRTLAAKGFDTLRAEIAAATDVVEAVIDSTERVVALRAEKGKQLSQVNAEGLAGLKSLTAQLTDLLDIHMKAAEGTEPDAEVDPTPEDIKALAAEARRLDLFSNIPNGE